MTLPKNRNYYLYFVSISANIMSFVTGIAMGWTSPAIPKLNGSVDPESNPLAENLTPTQESWVAGLLLLGVAIGAIFFGNLADKFGRKKTFFWYVAPVAVCFLMKAFANNVIYLYIARFIGGFGMGAGYAVLPVYLGEVAEDGNRGALGSLMILFATGGILFAYCVGPYTTIMWFSIVSAIPVAVFFFILVVYIPESPYFLVAKGRMELAEKSLKVLRKQKSPSEVAKELDGIRENVRVASGNKQNVLGLFGTSGLRKGLCITLVLMTVQQFSGMTVLFMNMQSIFQVAGSSLSPEVSAILIGVVQLLSCFTTQFVINKVGRKVLLMASAFTTGASQTIIGVYFYLQDGGCDVESISWLPLTCLVVFMVMLNVGLNPIPWVYIGEMFPPNMAATAATVATFTNLALSFCTSIAFPYLVAYVGMGVTFWFFAACCAFGLVFVILFVPETKGKSLHDIQVMLNS